MAYYDMNHNEVPYETNNWGEKVLARDSGGYYAQNPYVGIKYYQQDAQGNTLYNGPQGSSFTLVPSIPTTATMVGDSATPAQAAPSSAPTVGSNGDYAVGTQVTSGYGGGSTWNATYTYAGNGQWTYSDPFGRTGSSPVTTQQLSQAGALTGGGTPASGTTGTTGTTPPPPTTPTAAGTPAPSSTVIGGVDISNLPPELQATLQGINTYLQKLQANGQVVNPNIELTPEKLAEFTAQAQSEINPYYSTQLKLARENLLANAGYSTTEIQNNEQQLTKQYGLQFKQIGANAADQGFAQSGARVTSEDNLAADTQNTIDSGRRQLAFNTGQAERNFAQTYGGSNVPTINIGDAPTATGGEPTLKAGTGSRSLYTLDPAIYDGLVGTNEYQQTADVANRVSQLTGAFNSNAGITQQRALTL